MYIQQYSTNQNILLKKINIKNYLFFIKNLYRGNIF